MVWLLTVNLTYINLFSKQGEDSYKVLESSCRLIRNKNHKVWNSGYSMLLFLCLFQELTVALALALALVIGPPLSNWTPAKESSILPVMWNLLCMMFHKNKATFICKLLPFWLYNMYSFFILPSSLLTVESRLFLVDQAIYFLSIMRNWGVEVVQE